MTEKIFNYGIILILFSLGIILIGDVSNLWDTNKFITGWWNSFIIIFSLLIILTKKNKLTGMFILITSIAIILYLYNIIIFSDIFIITISAIFILLAVNIILHITKKRNPVKESKINEYYSSILSEVSEKINGPINNFGIYTLLGQTFIDLSETKISKEITIDITCFLGNVELILPKNVIVKTNIKSKFATLHNFRVNPNKSSKIINIESKCTLGEINIK